MTRREQEVRVPDSEEPISEATLVAWRKAPGDTVAVDEVIAEIMTDKVNLEIPSPASGVVVRLLVDEGDTVKGGQPIASINAEY